MQSEKPVLLTGLQPSGQLHIGNYLAALKPIADHCATHAEDYKTILLMVVDYHALTSLKDGDTLRRNIYDVTKDYLAVLGETNAAKLTIFKQSDVPQHTELTWIFNCVVTEAFLELGHAYKDKMAKGLEANFGLKDYPVLMAADILLYGDAVDQIRVPVGEDQRQHIEYARHIAAKFNTSFKGEPIFTSDVVAQIWGDVGKVPGVDGEKMSKSYKNTIPLFASEDDIRKAVMSIKTASVSQGESLGSESDIIPTLYRHFDLSDFRNFMEKYSSGSLGGYKAAKELLLEKILTQTAEIRERRKFITDEQVQKTLAQGSERARELAETKMKLVRKRIGVSL